MNTRLKVVETAATVESASLAFRLIDSEVVEDYWRPVTEDPGWFSMECWEFGDGIAYEVMYSSRVSHVEAERLMLRYAAPGHFAPVTHTRDENTGWNDDGCAVHILRAFQQKTPA